MTDNELKPDKNGVKTELEPCEDWYDVPSDEMTLEQAKQAVKDLRKKLAEYLEQKPCDMKQRVEKEYLYESLCEDLKRANAEIKRLLEPCEDAISRQAVFEVLKKNRYRFNISQEGYCEGKVLWSENLIKDDACKEIEQLPFVTSKEKTGKWINDWEMGMSECSCCGETYLWEDYKGTANFYFCPNCGTRMTESEDKE